MPLGRAEIIAVDIIDSARDDGFNAASYDLHAGFLLKAPTKVTELAEFLNGKHEIPENGIVLEPQGMVRVISPEYLRMPKNVVGYALTKNSLRIARHRGHRPVADLAPLPRSSDFRTPFQG